MKFTFEYDMQKGQCSACPLLRTRDDIDGWGYAWTCAFDDEVTALEVEPSECPLKEESELPKTVWHPYPKEKPTDNKEYRVTVPATPSSNSTICLYYHNKYDCWTSSRGKIFKGEVLAWMELPKPYKEVE